MANLNRYAQIIERIFSTRYAPGMRSVDFTRDDLISVAKELNITLPKNLGDVVYSFRYRAALPAAIQQTAPPRFSRLLRRVRAG